MTNYYFLTSMLPPIEIGHRPGIHFEELVEILKEHFSEKDFRKLTVMRQFIDLENLRSHLKEEAIDPRGNLSKEGIEETLLHREGYPEYVHEFLEKYSFEEDLLYRFPLLFARYFQKEIPKAKGFLHSYLDFERKWRLVMVGFRAKNLDRDVSSELQYEDSSDIFVAQILAQKDAKNFEPPFGYEDLKILFEDKMENPWAIHKALCEYRLKKIMDLEEGELFSADRVLGYIARLMIVEKWLELDYEEGKVIVKNMVKEAG